MTVKWSIIGGMEKDESHWATVITLFSADGFGIKKSVTKLFVLALERSLRRPHKTRCYADPVDYCAIAVNYLNFSLRSEKSFFKDLY